MSSGADSNEVYQQEIWVSSREHIAYVIDNLEDDNVMASYESLYSVNLLRSHRLVSYAILKSLEKSSRKAHLYANLVSLIDCDIPECGELLAEQCAAQFVEWHRKGLNYAAQSSLISMLGELFKLGSLHELVILELLQLLTTSDLVSNVGLTVDLMERAGRTLSEVSPAAHDMIFEELRSQLQMRSFDAKAERRVSLLFDARKKEYPVSASQEISLPPHDSVVHVFDLGELKVVSLEGLQRFQYDAHFFELEDQFESIKNAALERFPVAKNETDAFVVHDRTQSEDIQFKKSIYLLLKGSLSGEEAAHKLLKLRVRDEEKSRLVYVLAMTCSQETTYSKYYGLVAERLLSSHRAWKKAFATVFEENYTEVDNFKASQIRSLGKFWGHILASDYVGFEVFECIHMSEAETTPPKRVYVKFIFQELVAELGIPNLKARLDESYIQPFLNKIFPTQSAADLRFAINFFTAIGLGILTENLRETLFSLEAQFSAGEFEEKSHCPPHDLAIEAPAKSYVKKQELSEENQAAQDFVSGRDPSSSRARKAGPSTRPRSRTPLRQRSRSPARRRSRTPPRRRSRTPTRRRSRTPTR
ncbi:LAMI_0F16424g1_1 [Lachancea mirantina]|uniref:Pre-mRNA-splicing factor CWC22 n=1 Tax=Lachancea mirantina TaxID=1230905 RepID=A0A1G4K4X6_9SACH|nr:LAMI_0F16424g1_1 [Lachancea mirantina]